MTAPRSPAAERIVAAAVLAGAAALFGYHFALECSTLRLHEPMGYPEVVYRLIADVWPHQYQPGHFVDTQDNYGPGFSTFCRPFILAGFEPYEAARLANLAALSAAAAILLWILRRNASPWPVAAGIVSIFFALNAGSSSIQARPDFLETLMIVVLLAAGQPRLLGRGGGVRAALLGLLALGAYLTKPYGLLAWACAVSFPFVSGEAGLSRSRAAFIAVVSALVIVAGAAAYAAANPYFLLETVEFHFVHSDPSLSTLLIQFRDFAWLACGLVALVAAAAALRRKGTGAPWWPADPSQRYWWWATLLGAAALAAGPGWHRGAYLTYFYHLLLPPLAVAAAYAAVRIPAALSGAFLIANFSVLMAVAPKFPTPDPGWQALEADLSRQHGPVVVDYIMEPLARGREDARVAGNGINRFALDEPALVGGSSAAVAAARLEAASFVEAEHEAIRKGPGPEAIYMDCILFPVRPGDTRAPPGGFVAVPRNDHPLLLNGYDMSRYVPKTLFVLHPYYGSQNSPRQDAGKWIVTVVKFTRLADGKAPSDENHLPIALVPPVS